MNLIRLKKKLISYKLIQNMDTSINDRLNTKNQSVEAKKKIDNAIQRIEEVYEKKILKYQTESVPLKTD